MRLLFEIDKKDHGGCTQTFIRDSARSIIIRNGKIAMIHSQKYDYYKFPGGGIESGEDPIQAMIRETQEEAGLTVIPETIKEYGYVHRIQKSDHNPSECFIQDNLHAIINGVFQYALDEEIIDVSFTPIISGLGKNRKLFTPSKSKLPEYDATQVFTKEEAAKIMSVLKYDHINDLGIRLLFWTGLRIGELVALKWEDFSEDCSEIIVRRRQTSEKIGNRYIHPIVDHTKGAGTYRRVLVPAQEVIPILEGIKELNPDGDYLFLKDGEILTPGSFSSRLRRVCRWAGVEFKSLHKIRKTVVTELIDHQVPLPVIQGQVGHASASTTESFYYFNNKSKKENGRKIALALGDFLPFTTEV